MNDGLVIDALNRMSKHSEQLEQVLSKLYFAIQQQKASETPGSFHVFTMNLNLFGEAGGGIDAVQIMRNNPLRKRLIVTWQGADILAYSNKVFSQDVANQMQLMLNDAPNFPQAVYEVGFVGANQQVATIETSSPLYCMNFPELGNSQLGAIFTVIEETYLTPTQENQELAGLAGLLHQGYEATGLKNIK